MKLPLDQVRCKTSVTMGTGIINCNAHLFDLDSVNNIVLIKCWRCKSYHAYNFAQGSKLMVGDRVLT